MKTITYLHKRLTPSKIICVGRNYTEHIQELGNETPKEMVLFCKPNSAISDTLYFIQEDCRFEGEICFLIEDKRLAAVGFGFDLTKAKTQEYLKSKGLPWERAKAFDNSAVLSDFVPLKGDITTLEMKLYLNDTLQQHAHYELMIHKPDALLQEIQSFMSLEDGDIIMSGTPKGVATYKSGDVFRAEVYIEEEMIIDARFVAR
jgi:2-keto-4-pentenoate hydratase/2-oxohepta-3-ene-1,7-dioic acid hydratase in catechol pathway